MMRDGAHVFINEMQQSPGALEDATLAMLQFPWNCVSSDSSIQNVLKQKAPDTQTVSVVSSSTTKLRCKHRRVASCSHAPMLFFATGARSRWYHAEDAPGNVIFPCN